MQIEQIQKKLEDLFGQHRIVFWNDAEGEFESSLEDTALDGVKIIRPEEIGQFKTKITLEIDEPQQKFLVYAKQPEPEYEDDWLLDIRLYSYQFSADKATMLIDEMGLKNHRLRDYLNGRKKFFANKARLAGLKKLVKTDDTAASLDLKMLTVVTKSEHDDLFEIVRMIYKAVAEGKEGLDSVPAIWGQVQKNELEQAFWEFVKESFGYAEANPSLKDLLVCLLATDFAYAMGQALPDSLKHFVLSKQSNVAVCLGQWRDNSIKGQSYDKLSNLVAYALELDDQLSNIKLEQMLGVATFMGVERLIARQLRDRVIQTADAINADDIRQIAQRRQDMHWANNLLSSTAEVPRKALNAVYEAIIIAADFFELKNANAAGFDYSSASQIYEAYTSGLYRFDQLYRTFCEYAGTAESEGWDLLKDLQEKVEAAYCNWYLDSLAMKWGQLIEPGKWRIDGVANQFDFYKKFVAAKAGKGTSRGKITGYVIISDAFRYEAAEELTRELNSKYRFVADLKSMLGVLPSYTSLGMAALLPHKKLEYGDKGDVLVDSKPCSSFQQRADLLANYNGIAVKADDLLAMKKDQGRDFIRDKDIVYIYHNTIDAIGDSASTEGKTTFAVRKAVDELADLVRYIINNLNGSQIFVTADHGFIYTETKPNETDKNKLDNKPDTAVKVNKRYMLGKELPDINDSYAGKLSVTAGIEADSDMAFALPKGLSLFYFTGGARFVHGGMSLQETVVPVVVAGRVRGKAAEGTKGRKVSVQVLGTNHRITTSSHRFQLLQTDAVSERVKPITLKIAVFDGDKAVTNIETVTFDSSSDTMADRTKWITLTLQNADYDKDKVYYLILRDSEEKYEKQRLEVKIDRAFTNDF